MVSRALLLVALTLAPAAAGAVTADRYAAWLADEARFLAAPIEMDAFRSLASDGERDAFVRAFRAARDGTPTTVVNERMVEHGARLAEADRLFRECGQRGRDTDRGRALIALGRPLWRVAYAVSGLAPIEDWLCQSAPGSGLPRYFHLLFHRRPGEACSVFYDPGQAGPEALIAWRAGEARTHVVAMARLSNVSRELAAIAMGLVPGAEPVAAVAEGGRDALLEAVRERVGRGPSDWGYLARVPGLKTFDVGASVLGAFGRGPAAAAHLAVEMETAVLGLERRETTLHGEIRVVGDLADAASGIRLATYEARARVAIGAAEFGKVRDHPLAFEDVLPVLAGRRRLRLVVQDVGLGRFGFVDVTFDAPATPERGLRLGPLLVVAEGVEAVGEGLRPFALGGNLWFPARGAAVPLRATLRAIYETGYDLSAEHLEVRHEVLRPATGESVRAAFGRLPLADSEAREATTAGAGPSERERLRTGVVSGVVRMPLEDLEAGEYRLLVEVSVAGGLVDRGTTTFHVTDAPAREPPWVLVRRRSDSPFARVLDVVDQSAAMADGSARALLDVLLADRGLPPETEVAARLRLADFEEAVGRYASAAEALQPLTRDFSAATAALAARRIAQACERAGDPQGALDALSRALALSPRDRAIVDALARVSPQLRLPREPPRPRQNVLPK